jgi:alpha-galactosidase
VGLPRCQLLLLLPRACGEHFATCVLQHGCELALCLRADNSKLGGPYGWNYGDFLTTGGAGCSTLPPVTAHGPYLHCPGQNLYEYRTQFSVYAVAASPLIVSTDIRNMTAIMKQILLNKAVIAVNQQTTPPGDVVGEILGSDPAGSDKVQIWARELQVAGAGATSGTKPGLAVAAVNFANVSRSVTIPLSMVVARGGGLGKAKRLRVDDLWEHTTTGTVVAGGSLEVTVHPHDTKLLQLTAVGGSSSRTMISK